MLRAAQADPTFAHRSMQGVLEPVLPPCAAAVVIRLGPEVPWAAGCAAEFQADKVVFLIIARAPVAVVPGTELMSLQLVGVILGRPDATG